MFPFPFFPIRVLWVMCNFDVAENESESEDYTDELMQIQELFQIIQRWLNRLKQQVQLKWACRVRQQSIYSMLYMIKWDTIGEEEEERRRQRRHDNDVSGVTKISFFGIKKENYTYQIFTPSILDYKTLQALLSVLMRRRRCFYGWKQTELLMSDVQWDDDTDGEKSERYEECETSREINGKGTSHLGGVGVPVGSTYGTWLEGWAELTFPMSTGFKPVLVSYAAFPGFHTDRERERNTSWIWLSKIKTRHIFSYKQ